MQKITSILQDSIALLYDTEADLFITTIFYE